MKDGVNRFDKGFCIGISKELNKYLFLNYSITKGLISANKKYFNDKIYNQTLIFGFNYYF